MCQNSLAEGFTTAFKAACVMGFCLCSFGIFNLYILILLLGLYYDTAFEDSMTTMNFFEAVAGYGLGGSSIALFGRVGGGIYTKAADVGADLGENTLPFLFFCVNVASQCRCCDFGVALFSAKKWLFRAVVISNNATHKKTQSVKWK